MLIAVEYYINDQFVYKKIGVICQIHIKFLSDFNISYQ